jgi:exonuclease SbcC
LDQIRRLSLKLRSLELENYRKFKNIAIEFPDGLVGILGMNGVGKSTIVEAIAWALYGNKPPIYRTKKEDIKRIGTNPKDACRVALEFKFEGDNYQVIREMKGVNYTMKAEVHVNNKLAAQATQDVSDFLESKLGLDYQAFYTSVFAKQKELNALSSLDKGHRKKLVLRMLNINAVDFALKDLRKDKGVKKTEIETFRKILYDEDGNSKIDLLKNQLKTSKAEGKALQPEVKRVKARIDKLENELKGLKKEIESQEQKRDEFNKINTELASKSTALGSLKNDILTRSKELDDLVKKETKLKSLKGSEDEWQKVKTRKEELDKLRIEHNRKLELDTELERLKKDIGSRQEKVKAMETELTKFKDLEDEIKKLDKNRTQNQKEIEDKQTRITKLGAGIEQKKSQINELKGKLKEIEKLGPSSECPTCERPLEDHYDELVAKFKKDIGDSQNKAKKLELELKEQDAKLKDAIKLRQALEKRGQYLQQERLKLAGFRSELNSNKDELKGIESKLKEKEQAYKKLEKVEFSDQEYKKVEANHKKLEKVHEEILQLHAQVKKVPEVEQFIKKLNGDLKETEKVIDKLKGDLKTIEFDDKVYKNIKNDYDLKRNEINTSNLELKDIQNKIEKLDDKIANINSKLDELNNYEGQVVEKEEEIKYLVKLDEVMNQFKTHLISRISPMLSEYASELFRKLTDGKYNEMEVDENYNIYVYDEGEKYELGRFSGGEEDLANLCLRLAISQIIAERSGTSGLNFIILDEIFGSQDIGRKRNLMLALNELLKKFRQILVITHIEEVKEYIGNIINVVEDEQGISSVKLLG